MRRTKDIFFIYGRQEGELVISGYTDAGFQSDLDDFRSQSGFVFCLNGGAVSWRSSKQDTVTDSTIEAKYIVASDADKEAVWIKIFFFRLGVVPSITNPVDVYCDNNGAIAQAKEPRSHVIIKQYHVIVMVLKSHTCIYIITCIQTIPCHSVFNMT